MSESMSGSSPPTVPSSTQPRNSGALSIPALKNTSPITPLAAKATLKWVLKLAMRLRHPKNALV